MEIILLLLIILLVFFLTQPERLVNGDDSDFIETAALVTPDLNQEMIFATRDYLQKYNKLCGYCIETRSIKKFVNKNDNSTVKYKCVYMFIITGGGYPYGLSVNVELAADPKPRVLLLSLQPLTTKSDIKIVPYTDEVAKQFLSYDEIIASVKPKNLPIIS
jgi:hypothetical protein